MSEVLVSLPMYDWPELQNYNDVLYSCLKHSFRDHGFKAPEKLDRSQDQQEVWLKNTLLLSQTCGLPYMTSLKDRVSLVGTPSYDIACDEGQYYSVIIVHKNSSAESLEDLKNKRFTYSGRGSQSGYAALVYALSFIDRAGECFSDSHQSGSHRESIKTVASGEAEFAAIDAISWEIAKRHEAATEHLRVLALTEPTPGLPFITALRSAGEQELIFKAVEEGIASLDRVTRDALLLTGFTKTKPEDYQVIEDRLRNIHKNYISIN